MAERCELPIKSQILTNLKQIQQYKPLQVSIGFLQQYSCPRFPSSWEVYQGSLTRACACRKLGLPDTKLGVVYETLFLSEKPG